MNGPAQVPLLEQLRSVPNEAREWRAEPDGNGHRNIPYGRLCHEAADRIASLESTEPASKLALLARDDRIQKLDTELGLARAQIAADTERFEDMKARLEGAESIMDRQRETLQRVCNPLGGPLQMSPESIVAYHKWLLEIRNRAIAYVHGGSVINSTPAATDRMLQLTAALIHPNT